jgi:hypothetical protein
MDELKLAMLEEEIAEAQDDTLVTIKKSQAKELVRLSRYGLWVQRHYFRIASALNMIAASPKYGPATRKKAMEAFESMPSEGLPPNPAA